jgi:serine/threonine protein kinase
MRVVHGDLKDQNVVMKGGKPKLIDFGHSQKLSAHGTADLTGGTVEFCSPEQIINVKGIATTRPMRVTAKVDIWSLGLMFYYMAILNSRRAYNLAHIQKTLTERASIFVQVSHLHSHFLKKSICANKKIAGIMPGQLIPILLAYCQLTAQPGLASGALGNIPESSCMKWHTGLLARMWHTDPDKRSTAAEVVAALSMHTDAGAAAAACR